MRHLLLKSVAVAALVSPSAVMAQATTEGVASSDEAISDSEERSDNIITVTARRVDENVQTVPISMSVIGGVEIQDKALFEFDEIANQTPGLDIRGDTAGVNFVAIRGVGNLGTASPLSASVTVFVDDAPAADTSFLINSTLDIARVEVLRGPQGTLYGTNATAGAVNIYTTDPQLSGSVEGYVEGTYSVFDHNGSEAYNIEGALDFTLVEDVLGVRIAGSTLSDDGPIYNPVIDDYIRQSDQDNLRAKVLFQPNADFEAELTLGYFSGKSQEIFVIDVPKELGPLGSFTELELFDYEASATPPLSDEDRFYAVLNMNLETPIGRLTSITSYNDATVNLLRDFDSVFSVNDIVDFSFSGKNFNQELRLSGDTLNGDLSYLVGAIYSWGESDTVSITDLSDSGTIPVPLADPGGGGNGEAFALFTNNTINLNDTFSLSLGARVEHEKSNVSDILLDSGATALSVALGGGIVSSTFQDSRSETNFAYSAKLRAFVSEDVMIYGAYDRAFRGGGFNAGADDAFVAAGFGEFQTENVDAFELGFKSSWLDGRLQVNGAVYYQDFKNYQAQLFSPIVFADVTPQLDGILENAFGLPAGTLLNLGFPETDGLFIVLPTGGLVLNTPADNLGFEADFRFQATDSWSFGGSFSTNDFKFGNFPNVPVSPQGADPAILPDGTLSTFGFGRAYAGPNAQALLDAIGFLQGFPAGTIAVTGTPITSLTVPTADRSGLSGIADSRTIPSMSFTINSEFKRPFRLLGDEGEWYVRGVYAFNKLDSVNTPTLLRDYGVLNVFAGISNDDWSLQVFAKNLLNENYVTFAPGDIHRPTGPRAAPGNPRQIGMTVRKNF